VKVDDDLFAKAGEDANALAALHHADYCAVFKHNFDRFVAKGCELGQVLNLHLLVDLVLL